jgi:hypothetical protein
MLLKLERFIAQITGERSLPSMYALMILQTIPIMEGLITQITGKLSLSTMYTLMFLQMTLIPE